MASEERRPPINAGPASKKPQAAKPAPNFTSLSINKNTTGKIVAPRPVARRRPGAGAAAKPAPAPTPAAQPAKDGAQPSQTDPAPSSTPTTEQTTPQQLPTPAPTQEPTVQPSAEPSSTPAQPAPAADVPAVAVSEPDPTPPVDVLSTPQATGTDAQGTAEQHVEAREPTEAQNKRPAPLEEEEAERPAKRQRIDTQAAAEQHVEEQEPTEAQNKRPVPRGVEQTERSAKRQRIDAQNDAIPAQPSADTIQIPETISAQPSGDVVQAQDTVPAPQVEATAVPSVDALGVIEETAEEIPTAQPVEEETPEANPGGRRVLPWVAVNQPQVEGGDAPEGPTPTPKKARATPKPRGRRRAAPSVGGREVTESTGDVANDDDEANEDEANDVPSNPAPKPRGKRKARATEGEADMDGPAPVKRTRRARQAKSKSAVDDVPLEDEDNIDETEAEIAVQRKPRKPRQPKRKKPQSAQGEENGADGEEEATQPKRKGRPPREPTPDDAAERIIDPDDTFMDSLATRNIRVGTLSRREQEMRKIDWVEVRQRRREEDARPIESIAARDARERLEAEQNPTRGVGPGFQLVDGEIQLLPSSTTLDREANADREIEHYTLIEEQDLTSRITSRSFMKNNKRFPNEFVLPGQGKRWTVEDTLLFYQGLRSFGTDFQMISTMFPGTTRRSIKTKFTREERENPDDVREALQGKSEIVQNWDTFLKASQLEEENFADADEIKRQLAEEEAEMRERIAAAQAETAERKRQQREAGFLDEEDYDAVNRENGKEKRKEKAKEKAKPKTVTFQDEAGLEVLGDLATDAEWGRG